MVKRTKPRSTRVSHSAGAVTQTNLTERDDKDVAGSLPEQSEHDDSECGTVMGFDLSHSARGKDGDRGLCGK